VKTLDRTRRWKTAQWLECPLIQATVGPLAAHLLCAISLNESWRRRRRTRLRRLVPPSLAGIPRVSNVFGAIDKTKSGSSSTGMCRAVRYATTGITVSESMGGLSKYPHLRSAKRILIRVRSRRFCTGTRRAKFSKGRATTSPGRPPPLRQWGSDRIDVRAQWPGRSAMSAFDENRS